MAKRSSTYLLLVPIKTAEKLVYSEEFISKLTAAGVLQAHWICGTCYVQGRYLSRLIKRITLPPQDD